MRHACRCRNFRSYATDARYCRATTFDGEKFSGSAVRSVNLAGLLEEASLRDQRMLDLHDALRAFDFLKKTRPEALVAEYFSSCQRIRDEPPYSHDKTLTRRSEASRPELAQQDGYAPICLALLKLFR